MIEGGIDWGRVLGGTQVYTGVIKHTRLVLLVGWNMEVDWGTLGCWENSISALPGVGSYTFFYTWKMEVVGGGRLMWVNYRLLKGSCCQTHTFRYIWCRVQVVWIKLTLCFNHWWEIISCIFCNTGRKSLSRFSCTHSILSCERILKTQMSLFYLMTLSCHRIYAWITVLLSSSPCGLTSNWHRWKLWCLHQALFD